MKFLLLPAALLFLFSACTTTDRKRGVDKGALFYDYQVKGEEGSDSVTVVLQYRLGDEEGEPVLLQGSSKVSLDGTELIADSAKRSGPFYEARWLAASFTGVHTILYTDKEGKEHSQEFNYKPLTLTTGLPEQIEKLPFPVSLTGTEDASLRLVMVDTSFATPDVNEQVKAENGVLIITEKMWRSVNAGPIALEIFREQELPLKNGSKEAGRLTITYVVKREFEAVEK